MVKKKLRKDYVFSHTQLLIKKRQKMKKLILILACVSICTLGCNQKTAVPSEQTQNNIEVEGDMADMSFCQSCCMPMADDLYGTNADGTLNNDYCKYCYAWGEFSAPNLTLEGMIQMCIPFMVNRGMLEEDARMILESSLPTLKRWQPTE